MSDSRCAVCGDDEDFYLHGTHPWDAERAAKAGLTLHAFATVDAIALTTLRSAVREFLDALIDYNAGSESADERSDKARRVNESVLALRRLTTEGT